MHIIWTILIGFVAGLIAKAVMPGDNNPSGFFLTAAIGIAGSFAATFVGHAAGWDKAGQSAGFLASIVGAIILLGIYHVATKKG